MNKAKVVLTVLKVASLAMTVGLSLVDGKLEDKKIAEAVDAALKAKEKA